MSTKTQRQVIINFLIKNKGNIQGKDYKELGLSYIQALYNHLTSLEVRGYITKVGKRKYSVLEEEYKHEMIIEETKKELIRLREIERKYNQICNLFKDIE